MEPYVDRGLDRASLSKWSQWNTSNPPGDTCNALRGKKWIFSAASPRKPPCQLWVWILGLKEREWVCVTVVLHNTMLLGNLESICSEHIPYFKKSGQIKIPYFREADQNWQTWSMTNLTKILYKPFYTSLLFPSTHKGHLARIFKLYLYDPSKKRGLALQQIWSVEKKRISMLLIFLFRVSGRAVRTSVKTY